MMALLFDWIENQDDGVKMNRTTHMAMQSLMMFLVTLSPEELDKREDYREKVLSYVTKSFDSLMADREATKKFVTGSIDDGMCYLEGIGNEEFIDEMRSLRKAIRDLQRREDG
jgi:hypothetical protein